MDASVIIPTYNRREMLEDLLNCLAKQIIGQRRFEVIVVDDGSNDNTISLQKKPWPFQLIFIAQSNHGSATARNRGADIAQGKILIFLDDDMLVEEGYISGIIELHSQNRDAVGRGKLKPYLPEGSSIFRRMAAVQQVRNQENLTFSSCMTNNLSIEKDLFSRIGKMQDVAGDGPTYWGDVDFGYRAFLAGLIFLCSATAVCYHRDYGLENLETEAKRLFNASRYVLKLFKKYPGIEEYIPMYLDMMPVDMKKDSPRRMLRKVLRLIASQKLVGRTLLALAHLLEKRGNHEKELEALYRWVLGGYIFHGYRRGLELERQI